LLLLVACASLAESLVATIPSRVGGMTLDAIQVVDDSYLSGHPIDDVLAVLGKGRKEATVVFRDATNGKLSVGAIVVAGVSANDVLAATVENWLAPSVSRREERVLSGRSVWLLDIRPDHYMATYAQGDAVYVVVADDLGTVERALSLMP
jgi:hypothetical protein